MTLPDEEIRQYIEEERDRRAVRAWYANIAYLVVIAAAVVFVLLLVLGTVVS